MIYQFVQYTEMYYRYYSFGLQYISNTVCHILQFILSSGPSINTYIVRKPEIKPSARDVKITWDREEHYDEAVFIINPALEDNNNTVVSTPFDQNTTFSSVTIDKFYPGRKYTIFTYIRLYGVCSVDSYNASIFMSMLLVRKYKHYKY